MGETAKKAQGAEEESPVEEEVATAGSGSFKLPDQSTYTGDWVLVDNLKVRQGIGHHVAHQHDGRALQNSYHGEWEKDTMHGQGTFRYATGAKYQGQFQNNSYHGYGTYTFVDGSVYQGNFANNQPHGSGVFTDPHGAVWEGDFYNGVGPGMPATGQVVAR